MPWRPDLPGSSLSVFNRTIHFLRPRLPFNIFVNCLHTDPLFPLRGSAAGQGRGASLARVGCAWWRRASGARAGVAACEARAPAATGRRRCGARRRSLALRGERLTSNSTPRTIRAEAGAVGLQRPIMRPDRPTHSHHERRLPKLRAHASRWMPHNAKLSHRGDQHCRVLAVGVAHSLSVGLGAGRGTAAGNVELASQTRSVSQPRCERRIRSLTVPR